jgi:hypothetical protein
MSGTDQIEEEIIQGEIEEPEAKSQALIAVPAHVPITESLIERLLRQPVVRQTPFQEELERTGTTILFSKYPDNTLRLYKPDSIIGDTPAGYSERHVSVKVIVKTRNDEFMVSLKTTREELDRPGTEEYLAQAAYEWARR